MELSFSSSFPSSSSSEKYIRQKGEDGRVNVFEGGRKNFVKVRGRWGER